MPGFFRLSYYHSIHEISGFLTRHRSMDAAKNHRDSSFPESRANIIGPRGQRRHAGDGYKVNMSLEVDGINGFVNNLYFVVFRCMAG